MALRAHPDPGWSHFQSSASSSEDQVRTTVTGKRAELVRLYSGRVPCDKALPGPGPAKPLLTVLILPAQSAQGLSWNLPAAGMREGGRVGSDKRGLITRI